MDVGWPFAAGWAWDLSPLVRELLEAYSCCAFPRVVCKVASIEFRGPEYSAQSATLGSSSEAAAFVEGRGVALGVSAFAVCHTSQQLLRKPG